MTAPDDLIGDTGIPGRADFRTLVNGKGRPRKYPWADDMRHGDTRWIPGESVHGAVASTLRNRARRPGNPIRFVFRTEERDGVSGLLCVCVDARTDEGRTLLAPLRGGGGSPRGNAPALRRVRSPEEARRLAAEQKAEREARRLTEGDS